MRLAIKLLHILPLPRRVSVYALTLFQATTKDCQESYLAVLPYLYIFPQIFLLNTCSTFLFLQGGGKKLRRLPLSDVCDKSFLCLILFKKKQTNHFSCARNLHHSSVKAHIYAITNIINYGKQLRH